MGQENTVDDRIYALPMSDPARRAVIYPSVGLSAESNFLLNKLGSRCRAAQSNRHLSAHAAHGG